MLKKLKDECYIVMGQSPSSTNYNSDEIGTPFMQGRKTFGAKYPTIDTWTTKLTKIAQKGSVLMSVRAPVGDVNIAPDDLCIGRGLASIKMKNGNNQYLYYLLKNNSELLRNRSTGTVFEAINKEDLENIVLDFHDEKDQRKISTILSNIDKEILLNEQISINLHELLKTLYYNSFVLNKNGSWNVDRLGNYLYVDRGLSYKGQFLSEHGVPMINLGNIMPNGIFRVEKNKYYLGEYKEKVLTKVGDIVLANTDMTQNREVIGSPVIVPPIYDSDVIFSHHIYCLRNLKLPKMYIFYTLLTDQWNAESGGNATGTTVLALPKETIENYKIVVPDKESLVSFDKLSSPVQKKREQLMLENLKLEQLRDTLLPKLMNGEIDLNNVEI